MVIVLAGILVAVAFVVLIRLLWVSKRPAKSTTVITLAAAALVVGLAILAASGRLHWLVAAGAAILPFLRRAGSLLRYVPLVGRLFGTYQSARGAKGFGAGAGANDGSDRADGQMSLTQACQILGLGANPSRDEVIAAHRRLMQKLHPDRGGSTYLAQQLNEAKRVLLKSAR
jgi:DnaJ family protein C protein 19